MSYLKKINYMNHFISYKYCICAKFSHRELKWNFTTDTQRPSCVHSCSFGCSTSRSGIDPYVEVRG